MFKSLVFTLALISSHSFAASQSLQQPVPSQMLRFTCERIPGRDDADGTYQKFTLDLFRSGRAVLNHLIVTDSTLSGTQNWLNRLEADLNANPPTDHVTKNPLTAKEIRQDQQLARDLNQIIQAMSKDGVSMVTGPAPYVRKPLNPDYARFSLEAIGEGLSVPFQEAFLSRYLGTDKKYHSDPFYILVPDEMISPDDYRNEPENRFVKIQVQTDQGPAVDKFDCRAQ